MKISIITTCYNRDKTIRDTIESVLNQDYKEIEYIIIDGASTDNSLSIIQEYKERISTIISEPDNGMYAAINKGLRIASGDIIGLMHSDDVFFTNNIVSQLVTQFKKNNADLIYCDGIFVDINNSNKIVRNWISGNFSKQNIRMGWLPLHTTVYIKKECFKEMGLYNENYKISSDSDFLVRYFFKSNFNIVYFNKHIVKMRMGGLSTDTKTMKRKWKEDFNIYKSHGFNPYLALTCKILSKLPQFISAKLINK